MTLDCGAVRFEKWQALGNYYLIDEAKDLEFELTSGRNQAICAGPTSSAANAAPRAATR